MEEVDEVELVVQRVAALDLGKATLEACMRVPHPSKPGRRMQEIRGYATTTTAALLEMAIWLRQWGIERVVMESTSDYWKGVYYLLESEGFDCWLVNAREVKNVPGRAKTDRADAVWLARVAERGMCRPSLVHPPPIRRLRDLTRYRRALVSDRSREMQRVEKLLEDAQIKISSVLSDIHGVSGRAMMEALIAGQRDPQLLAELARGRMRVKRAALVEALTGRFDDHHAELARMLLDQIDALSAKIDALTLRIEALIAQIPAAQAPAVDETRGGEGDDPATAPLAAVARLDEITGIGVHTAQVLIAELGLDMRQFPTPGQLVSWAKLSPRTIQSGARNRSGKTGKGNRYLRGALGEAATAAAKTNTFLGERYRRLVKRRGKLKALVAIARSILVIVWHLLADPAAHYRDLGSDFYAKRIDKNRRQRHLIRQLEALGYTVTLEALPMAA